ncbi:COG4223 family protein [Microvirga roseola]|uniref:COG4223 family protein n=1 Tax=Microvirga roseola TaxID=2883126 RepID=UPI001E2FC5AD|nr:hypothetical protein [Microvirga roseola]
MTHSSDPRAPKSSRKKPAREPTTLDLKATVVDDGASREETKPEETISPEPEKAAQEEVSKPEATLDSGLATDSIAPETSSNEPPSQPPPPESGPVRDTDHRKTPLGALVGAGLLGGLVGAGILYGAQTWRGPEGQDDARLVQLEQQVATLGQQGVRPGDLQALSGRIGAVENTGASLNERLQALQSTAEQALAQAQEAANRPVPEVPAPQTDAALAQITERLSALDNQVQNVAQEAANAAQTATSALNAAQNLDGRIAELDSRLAAQQQSLSALSNDIGALSNRLAQENQGATSAFQTGTRIILAERLSDALRNGTPYVDVLEGLRHVEADPARLAPLEPFAQQGAPTAAEIAQRFEPLGAAILRESRGPAGGWTDRLLRMADRVVTVRPVDQPGSTGVPSLVARIEQALERGDVAEAVAAWQALPEPARRMSEEWAQQAAAVAQARQAGQAIADNALAALNRTAQ